MGIGEQKEEAGGRIAREGEKVRACINAMCARID
jgi:hypothetical protein